MARANLCSNQNPSGVAVRDIKEELSARFGGVTAYSHAPAEGVWRSGATKERDDIIIVEVMVEDLDRNWWQNYRTRLERGLNQEEIQQFVDAASAGAPFPFKSANFLREDSRTHGYR